MKTRQQEKAKNLYFQASMSKGEIAEKVGVNRRTILRWCKEDDWEKLRESSRHLPALVAEKCYHLIDAFASRLLQDPSLCAITLKDAQTIHLLASSIKKLKNRSTVNESMELFSFFLEGLHKKNPRLAAEVLPEMEEYIEARSSRDTSDFLFEGFGQNGAMKFSEKETAEQYADAEDLEALQQEIQKTGNYGQALENWQNADTPPEPDENNDFVKPQYPDLKNDSRLKNNGSLKNNTSFKSKEQIITAEPALNEV